jgi:alkanesulfonate monooxygenase SsuD/methylene tetrahydromethanopterin reductase-like flavin-dependent oxidoreductase (luciferase family)
MVRLGMYLEMRNPPQWHVPWDQYYGRWLDRIEEAERLGAESVWLAEHHFFDDGHVGQLWTMAAAIAARTKSMRIGTAISILPLHPTIELAEQIALVDAISGGRVEAGFGAGYREPEYVAFGRDFQGRNARFEQDIHELRQLWGEEPGANKVVTPGPVQRPVPVWGGFGGPKGAKKAGRLGLGLLSLDPSLLEPYLEGLAEAGLDASHARMATHVEIFVTDDPEKAWAEIGPHVVYRWRSLNKYMFEGTPYEAEAEANPFPYFQDEAIRERVIIGPPEEVVSRLRALMGNLPVSDLYTFSDFPGLSDELTDENIELTFTKVLPLLRESLESAPT